LPVALVYSAGLPRRMYVRARSRHPYTTHASQTRRHVLHGICYSVRPPGGTNSLFTRPVPRPAPHQPAATTGRPCAIASSSTLHPSEKASGSMCRHVGLCGNIETARTGRTYPSMFITAPRLKPRTAVEVHCPPEPTTSRAGCGGSSVAEPADGLQTGTGSPSQVAPDLAHSNRKRVVDAAVWWRPSRARPPPDWRSRLAVAHGSITSQIAACIKQCTTLADKAIKRSRYTAVVGEVAASSGAVGISSVPYSGCSTQPD